LTSPETLCSVASKSSEDARIVDASLRKRSALSARFRAEMSWYMA